LHLVKEHPEINLNIDLNLKAMLLKLQHTEISAMQFSSSNLQLFPT